MGDAVTTDLEQFAPVLSFNADAHCGRPLPFPEIRYRAPRNTMDPRWEACRDHHVACDCREAEWAEQLAELRAEGQLARLMEEAIDAVLAVHVASEHGSCSGCLHRYPCPTRSLVAHLSWREQMKAAR